MPDWHNPTSACSGGGVRPGPPWSSARHGTDRGTSSQNFNGKQEARRPFLISSKFDFLIILLFKCQSVLEDKPNLVIICVVCRESAFAIVSAARRRIFQRALETRNRTEVASVCLKQKLEKSF